MVLALQSIVSSIVIKKKSLRGGSEIWRRAKSFGGRSVLTTQSRPAFRLVEVGLGSARSPVKDSPRPIGVSA
jgi:hypothetical protein